MLLHLILVCLALHRYITSDSSSKSSDSALELTAGDECHSESDADCGESPVAVPTASAAGREDRTNVGQFGFSAFFSHPFAKTKNFFLRNETLPLRAPSEFF